MGRLSRERCSQRGSHLLVHWVVGPMIVFIVLDDAWLGLRAVVEADGGLRSEVHKSRGGEGVKAGHVSGQHWKGEALGPLKRETVPLASPSHQPRVLRDGHPLLLHPLDGFLTGGHGLNRVDRRWGMKPNSLNDNIQRQAYRLTSGKALACNMALEAKSCMQPSYLHISFACIYSRSVDGPRTCAIRGSEFSMLMFPISVGGLSGSSKSSSSITVIWGGGEECRGYGQRVMDKTRASGVGPKRKRCG